MAHLGLTNHDISSLDVAFASELGTVPEAK